MSADIMVMPFWIFRMSKTTHALSVPDYRERDFMLEQTVVQHLHDIGMSFHTGMRILLQYSDWDELTPV